MIPLFSTSRDDFFKLVLAFACFCEFVDVTAAAALQIFADAVVPDLHGVGVKGLALQFRFKADNLDIGNDTHVGSDAHRGVYEFLLSTITFGPTGRHIGLGFNDGREILRLATVEVLDLVFTADGLIDDVDSVGQIDANDSSGFTEEACVAIGS